GYSVIVALPDDAAIGPGSEVPLKTEFERVYRELYGHSPPAVPLELANLRARLSHRQPLPDPRLAGAAPYGTGEASPDDALKGERPAYFEQTGGFVATRVYDRYRMRPGPARPGPAIIEERETSIVVGPDATFALDPSGNIIIDIDLDS